MASQAEIARYQELRRQGYSGPQAAEMVWGPGGLARMNEEARKRASGNARNNALGQVGGTVAGAVGTKYAYDALFPTEEAAAEAVKASIGKAATGGMTGAVPTTSPVTSTIPYSTSSASGVSGGMSVAPNSSFSQNFKILDPSQMPRGTVAPEGMTAIQSNADGTIKMIPTEAANDPGFLSNANWGAIAQGTIGVVQLYGAYKSYKAGDKPGAALGGASGAANIASAAGADLGSSLVPGLNIATGLYTGYKVAQGTASAPAGNQRNKQSALGGAAAGASIGAGVGSIFPGIGTAIGAGVGAAIGATVAVTGSWFGSSKGAAQVQRDGVRKFLYNANVWDKKGQGTLADGSVYDFGKDGKSLKWSEIDKLEAANPALWSTAVEASRLLTANYGLMNKKGDDINAWYAKAAISNAKDDPETVKANVRHLLGQQGFTIDTVKQKIEEASADNKLSKPEYDRYMSAVNLVYSGASGAPGAPGAPAAAPVREVRPDKGTVRRLSPGMYRTDTGGIQTAPTMRQALEKAYRKGDGTKSEGKKG